MLAHLVFSFKWKNGVESFGGTMKERLKKKKKTETIASTTKRKLRVTITKHLSLLLLLQLLLLCFLTSPRHRHSGRSENILLFHYYKFWYSLCIIFASRKIHIILFPLSTNEWWSAPRDGKRKWEKEKEKKNYRNVHSFSYIIPYGLFVRYERAARHSGSGTRMRAVVVASTLSFIISSFFGLARLWRVAALTAEYIYRWNFNCVMLIFVKNFIFMSDGWLVEL